MKKVLKNIITKIAPICLAGIIACSSQSAKEIVPNTQKAITQSYSDSIIFTRQKEIKFNSPIIWENRELPENPSLEYAVRCIQTPNDAQKFLDTRFSYKDYDQKNIQARSVEKSYMMKNGVCIDYALLAATFLYDNGYGQNLLIMGDDTKLCHAVFLYDQYKKFGCLGNTPLAPTNENISELVKKLNKEYKTNFDKFGVYSLTGNVKDWITQDLEKKDWSNLPWCELED